MQQDDTIANGAKQRGATPVRLGRLGGFVGFRLKRIHLHFSQVFSQLTEGDGIRSGVFSSLAIIAANPGISQIELSREVGLDKSVMVSIIHELEEQGWAERRRSATDRRRHALHITAAGERQLDALFDVLHETEIKVLQTLTSGERQILNELLDRMYAAAMRAPR